MHAPYGFIVYVGTGPGYLISLSEPQCLTNTRRLHLGRRNGDGCVQPAVCRLFDGKRGLAARSLLLTRERLGDQLPGVGDAVQRDEAAHAAVGAPGPPVEAVKCEREPVPERCG